MTTDKCFQNVLGELSFISVSNQPSNFIFYKENLIKEKDEALHILFEFDIEIEISSELKLSI
jgi:hypothetical protein